MRIALVSPYDYSYPGGVIFHISHLANQLRRRGCQVKVLSPCSKKPLNGSVVPVGTPIPIPSGDSIARITLSFTLAGTVRKILQEESFDIIHLHEPLTPMLPLFILEFSRAINIGTFHACHGKPRGYRLFRAFLQKWFIKLHGHIAVSRAACNFVNQCFPAKYEIIPNGVDISHFHPGVKPLDEFKDEKINILYVGRLEKRKGVNYLLEAFKYIKSWQPQVRLIIVGPGERLRRKYRAFIEENKLKDVIFMGPVPYDQLPRYYAAADIFCAPSTGNESFGIVLIEAMASGKPIVATNIEGYSEVVQDKLHGFLVSPRDPLDLAKKLLLLIKDEGLRLEMGLRGEVKASQYSWENISQRVLDYYYHVSQSEKSPGFLNKIAIS